MSNGDDLSLIHSIWSGILTFLGAFFVLVIRKFWTQLDNKADRTEMNEKLGAIKKEMDDSHERQDVRHIENLDRFDHMIGRFDHLTERIDTLINRTTGGRQK